MTNATQDFVIYQPGQWGVHAFYPNLALAQADATAKSINGETYRASTWQEWEAMRGQEYLDQGPLKAITEELYYDRLGCLPPIYRRGAMGFFICEFLFGSITEQCVEYQNGFYSAHVDVACPETWITPEKIHALNASAKAA